MKIRGKFILPIAGLVVVAVFIAIIAVNFTVQKLVDHNNRGSTQATVTGFGSTGTAQQQRLVQDISRIGKKALSISAIFPEIGL